MIVLFHINGIPDNSVLTSSHSKAYFDEEMRVSNLPSPAPVALETTKTFLHYSRALDGLRDFFGAQDIAYVDSNEGFAEHYRHSNASLTYHVDSHWNGLGHTIAAEKLYASFSG